MPPLRSLLFPRLLWITTRHGDQDGQKTEISSNEKWAVFSSYTRSNLITTSYSLQGEHRRHQQNNLGNLMPSPNLQEFASTKLESLSSVTNALLCIKKKVISQGSHPSGDLTLGLVHSSWGSSLVGRNRCKLRQQKTGLCTDQEPGAEKPSHKRFSQNDAEVLQWEPPSWCQHGSS